MILNWDDVNIIIYPSPRMNSTSGHGLGVFAAVSVDVGVDVQLMTHGFVSPCWK